ncbi:MAG: hypothetical protein H0U74_15415 [Bradymonadaceae bacterium]|nr:hypothetical protein [Lujinxingiaceae bacterium]
MSKAALDNAQQTRKWRPSLLLGVALLIGALLLVSTASATVVRFADTTRLIEISDVIVQGKVAGQNTYFDQERGFVVTDTTISLSHVFFGKAEGRVTFSQWGGPYDDQIRFIPGDAQFEADEEVVLFLRRGEDGDNRLYLSALSQSKYKVYRTDAGQEFVSRDLSNLAFLIEEGGASRIDHVKERPVSVKSFHATLRSLIFGVKGGAQ